MVYSNLKLAVSLVEWIGRATRAVIMGCNPYSGLVMTGYAWQVCDVMGETAFVEGINQQSKKVVRGGGHKARFDSKVNGSPGRRTVHTSPTHIGSNVGNLYTAKWFGFWPLVANNVLAGLIFILCIPQLDSGISLLGLPSKTGMDKLLSDSMSSTRSY